MNCREPDDDVSSAYQIIFCPRQQKPWRRVEPSAAVCASVSTAGMRVLLLAKTHCNRQYILHTARGIGCQMFNQLENQASLFGKTLTAGRLS
jgi:hypothetical protein